MTWLTATEYMCC